MKYAFGFSWAGFLIVLLPMIPNVFYFLLPNAPQIGKTQNRLWILDGIEHASQFLSLGMLMFLVTDNPLSIQSFCLFAITFSLLSYYALWILLFSGIKTRIILICMAVFPVAYFMFAEFWLSNFPAMIPTVIFGIFHVIITYRSFCSTR